MSEINAFCEVRTLAEFTSHVRAFTETRPNAAMWFRGEEKASWTLAPRLLREQYASKAQHHESNFTYLFQSHAPAYRENFPDWWLGVQMLMQHHGCPTRLLDWTEASLAALFFAVRKLGSEKVQDDVDGCVYALDPKALAERGNPDWPNTIQVAQDFREQAREECLKEGGYSAPLPFLPTYVDARLLAQKGRFTLHGFVSQSQCAFPQGVLRKMMVPADAKKDLFWQLKEAGITATTLFPDLDALARELRCHLSHGEDVAW